MDTIQQVILQEENEKRYNRKHIDGYIREAIADSKDMQAKILQGVAFLIGFINAQYYASKMVRLAQLKDLDLTELVTDIFVGVAYYQREEVFTSVSASMASRLKFSDKPEAIKTMAEILAVLSATDGFDINKAGKMASLVLQSRIPLSDELIKFVNDSAYLPPMVCEPLELVNNYSSGYLSHKDSLILSNGNHHDGDICLDVLNLVNKVALQLDTQFLSTVEEAPTKEFTVGWAHKKAAEKGKCIDDAEAKKRVNKAIEHWHRFKVQSYSFYKLMVDQGNVFYLTNKVDKRGRQYAQGYHISTQSNAFKKACIELAHEELIEGMP